MTGPVLIVEGDPLQREMLGRMLKRKLSYDSSQAEHGRQALDILERDTEKAIKLVILDMEMPVMGGMEALEIIAQKYPGLPVIVLTGNKDIDAAVEAMKLGAIDFLTKPYEGGRMMVTVKNALKISTLSKEISRLQNEKEGRFTFEQLIGHEGGLSPTIALARKAAASNIPVMITGETGVGKEVFSKAIHGESTRAGKPFIAVNCGAIPAQLVESTLFGHEKGAFTGATEKTIGKFREAEGGTIFLDEVGELPLDTQVKLLRVLQQKEVEPVGAGKPVPVNVRIISATNRDLEAQIKDGAFREDLYFRLNVLQIELPPLRERKQDISMLLRHFIERYAAMNGSIAKDVARSAYIALEQYHWPGNVRQLENTVNRAMVISDNDTLMEHDFSSILTDSPDSAESQNGITTYARAQNTTSISMNHADGSAKTMDQIEAEAIELSLALNDGNITQASNKLGIAKSTFYKKIKAYGLIRPEG